jgi:hypothetical protein
MTMYWTWVGAKLVNDRVRGTGVEPAWIGCGTGATAASRTATALSTEVGTRVAGTTSTVTTTQTGDTWQLVATWNSGAAQTITNIANFDQLASGGNMDMIVDGQSLALANGDSLQVTFKRQWL